MLSRNTRSGALALTASLLFAQSGWAALSDYSQDFESLDAMDTAALTNDGWLAFGNVFDGVTGDYLFGYGPFGAPNDGANFSAIAVGEGGVDQGDQQLSIFSDYSCCVDEGHFVGNLVESNVFQERTLAADDVGKTYTFSFDAKKGNIAGATTALAFIKTLDPDAGFAQTNFVTVDMTSISDTWAGYSLSLLIDADLEGQILQFGFASTATNFEGSGIFYDNIDFGGGFSLTIGGVCPGLTTIDVSDATPSGTVALLTGTPGPFTIPGEANTCPGTELGLTSPGLKVGGTFTADENGDVSLSPDIMNEAACGAALQAVDLSTCETSDVGNLPEIVIPGGNLLSNSDFETGDLTGWEVFGDTESSSIVVLSGDNGPSEPGDNYAFLDNQAEALSLTLKQSTAAGSAGEGEVSYSFDLKLGEAAEGGVFFVEIFAEQAGGGVIGGSGVLGNYTPADWTAFTGTFMAPAGTDFLTIQLSAITGAAPGSISTMSVDNVSLSQ